MKKPSHLIINNLHAVPRRYWKYDRQRQSFELADGRRRRPAAGGLHDGDAGTEPGG